MKKTTKILKRKYLSPNRDSTPNTKGDKQYTSILRSTKKIVEHWGATELYKHKPFLSRWPSTFYELE
jgi:hypothetical protein